jgi:hypothetical protein
MEDNSLNSLLISILAIPFVIVIQLWVKERRERRRNDDGEEEFTTTRQAIMSFLIEGVAVVGGLAILIVAVSGIVRFVVHTYG